MSKIFSSIEEWKQILILMIPMYITTLVQRTFFFDGQVE